MLRIKCLSGVSACLSLSLSDAMVMGCAVFGTGYTVLSPSPAQLQVASHEFRVSNLVASLCRKLVVSDRGWPSSQRVSRWFSGCDRRRVAEQRVNLPGTSGPVYLPCRYYTYHTYQVRRW